MSFTFSVTITPPQCSTLKSELVALLESPTTFTVQAESADEACDLASLSIPWKLDPPYWDIEATWVPGSVPWYARGT